MENVSKKSRILFIYTNINGFHDDCYSFGLASIMSSSRAAGYECKILIIRSRDEFKHVTAEIKTFSPHVVGFSSVSSQFHFVKELAHKIKEVDPGIMTVCGGVHPTIAPASILESKHLDVFFMGESEKAFVEFMNCVEQGKDWKTTPNIAYGVNGKLAQNGLMPLIENLEELPPPDREVYPFGETIKNIGYATFLFSRGCPFSCSYCSNHAIAKRYGRISNIPRYRSPEASIREIEETRERFGMEKIMITDDLFGLDKKWRKEFCEKYKQRIGIPFMCFLRANVVDEEFAGLLKDAGCYRVSIGVESGNDFVRNKVMNRQMPRDMIVKAFRAAQKFGLETNALNIIGVPGETEEMILDTIRLNQELKLTSSGVNIFYPYKGTVLGDRCFDEGLVDEKLYNMFSNERRDSVLKYSKEFRGKLRYYRDNWEDIIYNKHWFKRLLNTFKRTYVGKKLVRVKKIFLPNVQLIK